MTDVTQHLKNHPRLIGALFTILLLLGQTGNVAATNASTFVGP
ncbi:hypothetical protein C478_11290 [Natrinema thermotolerans DSM 11552]|nr:hypothetical protein C478_11290 [Natrinema thermotolerans DSM 11552]